jgi:ABC-2 type transport system permease protein
MYMHRIIALILRYIVEIPRDFFRIFDLIFFPLMDIILWGFMSMWIQTAGDQSSQIGSMILVSLVLWMVVENTNREIVSNLTEELYAHNLINILVTPLQLSEWLCSVVILAFARAAFVFVLSSLAILLLSDINIAHLGLFICAIFPLLLMSGTALGLGISALMLRWGKRIAASIWSIPYLVLSFSAVLYPLCLLPPWAQYVGKMIPISYVFEALRFKLEHGCTPWHDLLVSLGLNITYLVCLLFLFVWMFDKSREHGLAQLEN